MLLAAALTTTKHATCSAWFCSANTDRGGMCFRKAVADRFGRGCSRRKSRKCVAMCGTNGGDFMMGCGYVGIELATGIVLNPRAY